MNFLVVGRNYKKKWLYQKSIQIVMIIVLFMFLLVVKQIHQNKKVLQWNQKFLSSLKIVYNFLREWELDIIKKSKILLISLIWFLQKKLTRAIEQLK